MTILLLLALQSAAAPVVPQVHKGSCWLPLAPGWTVSGGNAQSGDGSISVAVDEIGDGIASINLELGMQGTVVENGAPRVLQHDISNAVTRLLAVTPPVNGPACRAQFRTTPGGAAAARAIARGLRRQP